MEKRFTSDAGIKGNYLVYNTDAPTSNGLLVWLHGDGEFEYHNSQSKEYLAGDDGIVAQAIAKNMKLIVPEAPSGEGIWWKHGETNTDWLTDLIYNQKGSSGKVWLAGFSGGAEEISYFVLPLLKETGITSGGAIMFGGGGSPKVEKLVKSLPKSSVVKGDFLLTWVVGEKDTGWDDDGFNAVKMTQQGADFYMSQGWDVTRILVPGKLHVLNNNGVGMYGSYIRRIMK